MKENDVQSLCFAPNLYAKPVSPAENVPEAKFAANPFTKRKNRTSGAPSSAEGAPAFLDDYRLAQEALDDLRVAEAVLRRVYPRISEIVRSVAGAAHNVDDITQLAAIEVARCLDRYHGRGSIESWASKIAYRKAMRVLKREWRKKKLTFFINDEDFEDRHTTSPEKSLSREQLFDAFISKMSGIPDKRRTPLILHMIYGYTVREVSELTDVSINTVKDRLKTGSREFRTMLDNNPTLVTAMLEELS